jgi:hypothetical protein
MIKEQTSVTAIATSTADIKFILNAIFPMGIRQNIFPASA